MTRKRRLTEAEIHAIAVSGAEKMFRESQTRSFTGTADALSTLSNAADNLRGRLNRKDYATKTQKKQLQRDFVNTIKEMHSLVRLLRKLRS